MFVFLCILCGCNAVSLTHDVWTHSAKQRNKMLHALHGNGGPNSSKGKGKGRSKNQRDNSSSSTGPDVPVSFPIELSDQDIASQVRALVPEAAHRRAQTRLEADEWDAPVYDHQALTKQGGISIAPKNSIAEIVQRIGYTTNPVALVVTEPPEALGLRGYPRKKVTCTVSYINDQGERSTTQVQKFLIQLGFGAEVSQTFQGPKVQIMTTMRPMIAKFPPRHHWPTGQIPASTVAQEVEQHIPRHAFYDIISRESQSAALLVHMDYINALLRASGVNGAFYKLRMSEQESPMELLWLPDEFDLPGALALAKNDGAYGVVEKGKEAAYRYAIRFRTVEALQEFATKHSVPDTSHLGRWRLSGAHTATGIHGCLAFLTAHSWEEVQILFLKQDEIIFLASKCGQLGPMHYEFDGSMRQLRFKALDKRAEFLSKEASQASRTTTTRVNRRTDARMSQEAFLKQVMPDSSTAPGKEQAKRPTVAKTGDTPEPKVRKEG